MGFFKTAIKETFKTSFNQLPLYLIIVIVAIALNSLIFNIYSTEDLLNNMPFLSMSIIYMKEIIISVLFYAFGIYIQKLMYNSSNKSFLKAIKIGFYISLATFINVFIATFIFGFIIGLTVDLTINFLFIFMALLYSMGVAYIIIYQIGKILNEDTESFSEIYSNISSAFLLKPFSLFKSVEYFKNSLKYFVGFLIISIIVFIISFFLIVTLQTLKLPTNIVSIINYSFVYIFAPLISSYNFVSYRYIYNTVSTIEDSSKKEEVQKID